MTYGFNLGKLNSDSIGLSYVSQFEYLGGSIVQTYTSEAFAFASGVEAILLPQTDVPANIIPIFPSIYTSLDTNNKVIAVGVSGGNISSTILVFIK